MDEPVGTHQRVHRPSQESDLALVGAHQGMMKENSTMSSPKNEIKAQDLQDKTEKVSKDEPILNAANKLLSELKKAYSQILLEKEEEVCLLKEEIADLKTLVRVLESENARLKSNRTINDNKFIG